MLAQHGGRSTQFHVIPSSFKRSVIPCNQVRIDAVASIALVPASKLVRTYSDCKNCQSVLDT